MKKLTLLLISSLLAACATNVQKTQGVQLPDWFYNPNIPGYVGVSSIAPPQSFGGIKAQQRVAELKAQAELGRMKQLLVQSETRLHQSNQQKSDMQTQSRLSSATTLDLSRTMVREQWLHPKTGDLYLWMLAPKQ
ncbi:MAG: hypothetical protein OEY11_00480 [Gammaproteobacteria bacterium]|nr:hypothetical protein [Gammaproteobacteria bacterium]